MTIDVTILKRDVKCQACNEDEPFIKIEVEYGTDLRLCKTAAQTLLNQLNKILK